MIENELFEKFYQKMYLIRCFEENLLNLFDEGILFGTTHTSLGQEALAVALAEATKIDDPFFSNHRCHGHYIAKSNNPVSLLNEIMGKVGGICEGYGGSQHIYSENFYSNGIQGGYVPIVAGIAQAEKMKKSDLIAVGLIGDGTLGEGNVYEGLNLMSIYNTPSLIIVENNQYAQSTATAKTTSGNIADRAKAFGIPCTEVESNDIKIVFEKIQTVVNQVRETKQPQVFVYHTYRLGPHSKGDDNRPVEEIEAWKKKDPLLYAEKHLDQKTIKVIQSEVDELIDKITKEAKAAEYAHININKLFEESLWKEDTYKL